MSSIIFISENKVISVLKYNRIRKPIQGTNVRNIYMQRYINRKKQRQREILEIVKSAVTDVHLNH